MFDPVITHCERQYAEADVLMHGMAILLYRARRVLDDTDGPMLAATAGELEFTLATALMVGSHARSLHDRISARLAAFDGSPRTPAGLDPRLSAASEAMARLIAIAAGLVEEIGSVARRPISQEGADLEGLLERLSTY